MDKYWICDLKLTLEQIVLRKVGVILLTDANILASFQNLPYNFFSEEERSWPKHVEYKVQEKILKLKLPKTMLEQLMGIVKPIGMEILRWKMFHEQYLGFSNICLHSQVLNHLMWTPAGSVDYRKTTHNIIHLEILSVRNRYKLACLYCLEDDISVTWKALSDGNKKLFYKGEVALQAREPKMEFCWTYVLKKEESGLYCPPERRFATPTVCCQYAFVSSAVKGNKAAAEYFFQKLTNDERDACLVTTAKAVMEKRDVESDGSLYEFLKHKLSDVLCYLFNQMTPEQQGTICNECPFHFLRCFLDWPYQHHFADLTALVFEFPFENRYQYFKDFIISNVNHGSPYCSVFFQKVFPLSPQDFRKHCVDRECNSSAMFFKVSYITTETVKAMFRSVDSEDKVRLVSCDNFFNCVDPLFVVGKWNIIKLCLKEALLSKEGRDRVKDAYDEFWRKNGMSPVQNTLLYIRHKIRKIFLAFLDKMDVRSLN